METIIEKDTIRTITTHYIDGAFVESHGGEVMDVIKPTNGQLIGRVMLGDAEDTRRAIAAAKRAFASFGRTTKEERSRYLRHLHKAVSARLDDLTAVMIEEYGGVARFARLSVESGVNAFAAAESALQELPLRESWGKTTVTLEPVGVAGLITAWNANALFICLKMASALAAGRRRRPPEGSRSRLLREAHGVRQCGERHDHRPGRDFRPRAQCDRLRLRGRSDPHCQRFQNTVSTPPSWGLTSSARRVASQLQAGRVVIDNMTDDPQAPWGGFKCSGVGREYGKYGIEAFVEPKAILE